MSGTRIGIGVGLPLSGARGNFWHYPADAVVRVGVTGDPLTDGASLVAAYSQASALTPGGRSLSASNRACVKLPVGSYELTESLVLSAEYVDIVAENPELGGPLLETDEETDPFLGGNSLDYYRPSSTVVYAQSATQFSLFEQTAADVRMRGFTAAILSDTSAWNVSIGQPTAALLIGNALAGDVDNSPSVYEDMYFWSRGSYFEDLGGVRGYFSFRGTWRRCRASGCSFRTGYGDVSNFPAEIVFAANMYDCDAGPFSFIGDPYPFQTYTAKNCRLERCRCIGKNYEMNSDPNSVLSGYAAFAGCTVVGVKIESTVTMVDCEAGANSFGLGNECAGTFIRCTGGAHCFGATKDAGSGGLTTGTFIGVATDCVAGPDSFGGRTSASDADNADMLCSGTLTDCVGLGNTRPVNLSSATISGGEFTNTTADQDLFALLDSGSAIDGAILKVRQNDSGIPVNAAAAQSVSVSNCTMNNASVDADGLGENVTNTASPANNTVTDDDDPDALAYIAATGATDAENVNAWAKALKDQSLWDQSVCYLLRNGQNTASGAFKSLGGGGSYDATVTGTVSRDADGVSCAGGNNSLGSNAGRDFGTGAFSVMLIAERIKVDANARTIAGVYPVTVTEPAFDMSIAAAMSADLLVRAPNNTSFSRVTGGSITSDVFASIVLTRNGQTLNNIINGSSVGTNAGLDAGVNFTMTTYQFKLLTRDGAPQSTDVARIAMALLVKGTALTTTQVGNLLTAYKAGVGTGLGLP